MPFHHFSALAMFAAPYYNFTSNIFFFPSVYITFKYPQDLCLAVHLNMTTIEGILQKPRERWGVVMVIRQKACCLKIPDTNTSGGSVKVAQVANVY